LPETPAYAKDYREKFKIQTLKNKASLSNIYVPLRLKDGFNADKGIAYYSQADIDQTTTEVVVGTMSYSSDDWIKMYILQSLVSATAGTDILSLIAKYMFNEHQMKYGDFYYWVMDKIILNSNKDTRLIEVKKAVTDWVNRDISTIQCDYSEDFPYTILPANYILFVILVESKEFFTQLADLLFEETEDEKVYDLCYYSKNRLITLDYKINKKFQTNFDWMLYDEKEVLLKEQKSYIIKDVNANWKLQPNRLIHFLYNVGFDLSSSKVAKNIIKK
jgi:hypothetical protein